MEVLAIIPARGGSKSIPKKNIYLINGKPLIAYSIIAAQKAKRITRVIVTTDNEEIASVARECGAEVPFMRPKDLSEDTTPDLPVFEHALTWLKKNEGYIPDAVVHLWPTSPLRKEEDIDKAIELLLAHPDADSVRSVTTPSQTPFKMWRRDQGTYLTPILQKEYKEFYENNPEPHSLPRQLLPEIVVQTGYLAVIRPHIITDMHSMSGKNILPCYHDPDLYTELDSLKDLHHTEFMLKKYE